VDAFEVIKVCIRRWWVLLPVVLLAVGAGYGLVKQQKPLYYGFGGFALVYTYGSELAPGAADPRNENPLANGGAELLGEAVMSDFSSAASQARYGGKDTLGTAPSEADNHSKFRVTVPQGSSTYLVETWGPSSEGVREVVDSVIAAAPRSAKVIQDRAGAPTKSQYTTFVTSPTQVAEMPPESRIKLILAVSAVGLMAGASLAVIVDALIRRRRRRQLENTTHEVALSTAPAPHHEPVDTTPSRAAPTPHDESGAPTGQRERSPGRGPDGSPTPPAPRPKRRRGRPRQGVRISEESSGSLQGPGSETGPTPVDDSDQELIRGATRVP
jgi:hypothetical protein